MFPRRLGREQSGGDGLCEVMNGIIDVVERDYNVLDLVALHLPKKRGADRRCPTLSALFLTESFCFSSCISINRPAKSDRL